MAKKSTPAQNLKTLKFQSKLESISDELEYYAIPVPLKTTEALKTRAAVAVKAQVNGSEPFQVSLHPTGGGRHSMRVKASVRKETGIKEGDRVEVRITVLPADTAIPKDLETALKAEGVLADFKAITNGKRRYLIRCIDEVAKPETRKKRIQEAIEVAHLVREKRADRS